MQKWQVRPGVSAGAATDKRRDKCLPTYGRKRVQADLDQNDAPVLAAPGQRWSLVQWPPCRLGGVRHAGALVQHA